MFKVLKQFARDESGATAVEYGLVAGLISVVIVLSLRSVGTKVNTKFGNVAAALN